MENIIIYGNKYQTYKEEMKEEMKEKGKERYEN
jgi:hypothetical protein